MNATQKHYEQMHRAWPDNELIAFMLAHGRDYSTGPATFAGPRAEPGQCYMNATHLAQNNPTLTYVEGSVLMFNAVPIQHAWCVTADGLVIDPTLAPSVKDGSLDRISDYFGVPFQTDYVIKACLKNGVYGLLDIFTARKTMPKLIELGLEDGQRWLLDRRAKRSGIGKKARA